MNTHEKVFSFLERQKQENLRLDEVDGKLDRERSGFDKPGLRNALYQNTINWVKAEATDPDSGLLREFVKLEQPDVISEDTLTTAIATFTTSLLPAVRRIYNKLIAMDLVSVQPLSGPTGLIYWIDHLFGTTGGGATAGQRLDQYRHNAYATSSEQGTIREVNFQLVSDTITTIIKKIKAEWTIEAEQDLRSQWGMNLENELMPKLVNEIVRETDGMVIAALLAGVAHNVNWNANGYRTEDAKVTLYRKEYDATLYDAILEANNEIYKSKFRNANWILVHPDNYLRLAKLEHFNVDPLAQANMGDMGRRYVGTLGGGMFKVYVDPEFSSTTKLLMGFRSDDWQYAVGYYAPYIPLFTSARYIINDDFTQFARGAMTRFAYGIIPEEKDGTTNNGLATVSITLS